MNLPSLFRRNGAEPLRALSRLQNEFDRLFQELSEGKSDFAMTAFKPSCEIREDKSTYTLKFDMPGVKKEDVKLELEGNQLTVSAERQEEKTTEDKKSGYSEISYGSYQRSMTLPSAVDEKKADAKFENGVLTLTLPKVQPSNAKQIAIQ
jgi:HSP20 family protein